MNAKELRKGLLKLKRSIRPVAEQTVRETEEAFIEAQKSQLLRGESAKGTKLAKYRTQSYAAIKHLQNPLAGFGQVDLHRTGAFFSGFRLNLAGSKIRLYSTDQKAPFLLQKYNDDLVFGLTVPNLAEVVEKSYKPAFKKNILTLINPSNGI